MSEQLSNNAGQEESNPWEEMMTMPPVMETEPPEETETPVPRSDLVEGWMKRLTELNDTDANEPTA